MYNEHIGNNVIKYLCRHPMHPGLLPDSARPFEVIQMFRLVLSPVAHDWARAW